MSWRPIIESDVNDAGSAGCTVTVGFLSFLLYQGGNDDPDSSSYYAYFGEPKKKIRVSPIDATVQPFVTPGVDDAFVPARVAGYETSDEIINPLYAGPALITEPLVGWPGGVTMETTVNYLDFHGANTGSVYNEQTAVFAVEVWDEGEGPTPPAPGSCFWVDLVNATQECGDAPPVGVFIDCKIHYTCDAYEGTGISLAGSGMNGGPAVLPWKEVELVAYYILGEEPQGDIVPGVESTAEFVWPAAPQGFVSYGGGYVNLSKSKLEELDPSLVPGVWIAAVIKYYAYNTEAEEAQFEGVMTFRIKANDGDWPACE